MTERFDLGGLRLSAIVAIVFAATFTVFLLLVDPDGLPRRLHGRYLAAIGRRLRRQFVFLPPRRIADAQIAAAIAVVSVAIFLGLPAAATAGVVLAIGVAPYVVIERRRRARIVAIEEQLDGFVLALANALKTTPSLGDAVRAVAVVTPAPLGQEIDLALKEIRVGATLEQALGMVASRVGSRTFDVAMTAILVGRRVGGDLPRVLETVAASLREMKRLEGVLRTKTAEGRMQLIVLAVFPFALMFGIDAISEGYFRPLGEGIAGPVVVLLAACFWIGSLAMARSILAVDA